MSSSTDLVSSRADAPRVSGWHRLRLDTFFALLYLVTLITAFPSNSVYYLAPFVVVLWARMPGSIVSVRKLGAMGFLLLTYTVLSLALNELRSIQNNYAGVLFAGVTWLPMLILLSNRGDRLRMDDRATHRLVVFLSGFVILQAVTVAFQMTQTDVWDALAGTYGLFDYLGSVTISQVFFTFNVLVISLFLIPYWSLRIVKLALAAGFAAVAAAQSGHQTIFFLVTILTVFASAKRIGLWLRVVLAGAFLVAAVLWFFPQTPALAIQWLQRAAFQDFPKRLMMLEAFELLKDPKIALVGTGIGQFTSRAALFSSGEYLNASLPSVLTGQSVWYRDIVAPLIELQERVGEGSAIAKPYLSAVTLPVELGLIVTGLFGWWVLGQIRRARKMASTGIREVEGLARFQSGFIIFLMLCSLVENYLEFVQALMLPIMLYVFASARIAYCLERDEARA